MRYTLFFVLLLCSIGPLFGQLKSIPPPPDSLIAKADEWEQKTADDEQFIEDEEALAFASEIMTDLLKAAGYDPTPFRLRIQNSLTINAAMYPNGLMLLTSGLLLRLNSREELSLVIGHELAHYLLEHHGAEQKDNLEEAQLQSLMHEYQADSLGFALMKSADLPLAAAVSALEKLPPSTNRLIKVSFLFSVDTRTVMTHPPTPRRIERIRRMGNLTDQDTYVASGEYHEKLGALRQNARWETLNAGGVARQTLKIITIDSLIDNLPKGGSSDYVLYLRFQQSEAILNLMQSQNSLVSGDLKYGLARTTYRNNDSSKEDAYYSYSLGDLFGNGSLQEVHKLFAPRLLKNLELMQQSDTYRTESKRLRGLYTYVQEQYADARDILTDYLADQPTHPSRRYARALLKRMPTKNKKKFKYE